MNFQDFCNQKERMCRTKNNCNECTFGEKKNQYDTCLEYIMTHPKEAETYINEWIAAHPLKTNSEKFIEIFNKELCVSHENPGYLFFIDNDIHTKEQVLNWLNEEYKGE